VGEPIWMPPSKPTADTPDPLARGRFPAMLSPGCILLNVHAIAVRSTVNTLSMLVGPVHRGLIWT